MISRQGFNWKNLTGFKNLSGLRDGYLKIMIFTELKYYLVENKRAVLKDLAHHFDTTPAAVKGMLEHWIRKGKVRRVEGSLCNKGCCKAEPAQLEIYEWVELK